MNSVDIFPWNEHFNTGLITVDKQHKKLVDILNSLASHIAYNSSEDDLNTIFDELANYTIYHFETEENYFAVFNYKNKEEHINEHNTFRNFVNDIKKEDISNIEFDKKLFEFLNTWILHHIKEVDMKYVDFLKKHLL